MAFNDGLRKAESQKELADSCCIVSELCLPLSGVFTFLIISVWTQQHWLMECNLRELCVYF